MNPLKEICFSKASGADWQLFCRGEQAEAIRAEAGEEYQRILKKQPELKKHKGAMVLPAVVLY